MKGQEASQQAQKMPPKVGTKQLKCNSWLATQYFMAINSSWLADRVDYKKV
jgi:hypothetical protein